MLNRREPTATNRRFLFGSQVRENMFWTAFSGVGIWTAYEVVTLWAFANGTSRCWIGRRIRSISCCCSAPSR